MLRIKFFYPLFLLALLTACSAGEKPLSKKEVASPHGVIILYDEDTRNWSDINNCDFENEAKKWVQKTYPLAVIIDSDWASAGFYFVLVETGTERFKVYFDGTIVNIYRQCKRW